MEEQNEILTAVKEGFARVDERFARVDEQFVKLRHEFAEQLDGVSSALHLELKAQIARVSAKISGLGVELETIDTKVGLLGENVANVVTQLSRYNATVEAPLERRVTKLEERVLTLEEKK